MARTDLQRVLAAARQLPARARAEIVQTLLREAGVPPVESADRLEALWGLSEPELRSLAAAVLAPARERRLKMLLRRNREGTLDDKAEKDPDPPTFAPHAGRGLKLSMQVGRMPGQSLSPRTRGADGNMYVASSQ